ncbi:PREDICTED: glucan endo-1,3-beta-glucosidase 8-like [Nelumbo nucifera]|uniref:glucan endo-1,3-beta-D-glucosidase n=2 Tax=Nelumbo nucifera TaxID=4432 RepID=A0A1U8AFY0_NELNU|nr:PREDICTED: glucan endo-1,3-beta-glucosidase 8-like [Nelumbo nucifera]DAD40137.1 TPA_asm: hypothetical protein HUJ06_014460 [Nelumbo nucifera]
MAVRAKVLMIWVFCLVLLSANPAQGIGVNWGIIMSHPLLPATVVRMLKDNGIKKVKLFDSDSWTVNSLAGSGIQVMVAIPNDQLERFSDDYDNAKDWVHDNITSHLYKGGVDIKYVAIGNEPFLKSYNGRFTNHTFPALKNIQRALDEAGLGDKIKATTPLNADVYDSSTGTPSGGNFRKDIRELMIKIVKFLNANNAPFVVNIYPFLSLYQNDDFPMEFAFFDSDSSPIVDNGIKYTNVLDANHDTLVWSLKKAGVPNLKIIIGEIGWPTDGHKKANVHYAKRFYDGLFKKLASDKGTPLRPGKMDVYLFGLFDENMKSILPGFFERHWGIFRYDGKPKFPMDFSGQGHDKLPVGAKGVQYLPAQWCILDRKIKNVNLVPANMDYACTYADCSALVYGGSCNGMDIYGNVSYAFNMYFQMQNQDVQACDFQGLAVLTTKNASRGSCLFPIEIVSAGERLELRSTTTLFLILMIIIRFTLL